MDALYNFCSKIRGCIQVEGAFTISQAREVITNINAYLYTNYPGIGYTTELGREFEFLSDFHKFWKEHHREILDCTINEKKCAEVADILHSIYQQTNGSAFREIYDSQFKKEETV